MDAVQKQDAFESFLAQQDEKSWGEALDILLPLVHPVDQDATRIWFAFWPLQLHQIFQESDDLERTAQNLELRGGYRLEKQLDSSLDFLYGSRYWSEVQAAVYTHADRGHKKPFVQITFVFFTLFPLVLLFCQSFWPLVVVFVLRGFKEFGEPTRKALIMDLAPENRKAGMFGLYYLLRDVVVSVAAFGGAYLWIIGPEVNLWVAFGFGVLGTGWFTWKGRDLSRFP